MLDDKEHERKVADVKTCRRNMEVIDKSDKMRKRKLKYTELGICCRCEFLHGETTAYGTKRFWCNEEGRIRRLSPNDPLIDCTDFVEAGQMPLSMMLGMAIPIETKVKRQVGFITDEEYSDLDMIADYGDDF